MMESFAEVVQAPREFPPILELGVPFAHDGAKAIRGIGVQPGGAVGLLEIATTVHEVLNPAVIVRAELSGPKIDLAGVGMLAQFPPYARQFRCVDILHPGVIQQAGFQQSIP